ncbi:bifunctional nuclease family protein [Tessaracoccus sp. OS52]|uniref:bifunctional nuclease family protein n=1 Tax=Tessaracoccus sp. OS52 TaxID=2886691 RepID=UPI001D12585B|nr:bifunctional nuclease family protein [Tessaracoccus sp. OS52]MCC2592865.1 bifunctional nuclease family protein [Tessaracoccus sp. OS52]
MIKLDVIGIRLTSPEDSPVLLLRERTGSRLLPIWISSVDAAGIALLLDGDDSFHRPLTHDLLAAMVAELNDKEEPGVVRITEMRDGVFHAVLEVGEYVFDARPSDGINLALRLGWSVECAEQLMDQVGVEVDEGGTDEVERFREFLDSVNPDDFENDDS